MKPFHITLITQAIIAALQIFWPHPSLHGWGQVFFFATMILVSYEGLMQQVKFNRKAFEQSMHWHREQLRVIASQMEVQHQQFSAMIAENKLKNAELMQQINTLRNENNG